jgi:hypothetical protein
MLKVPIISGCTSQTYDTVPPPVVKLTVHVWCPVPCTTEAQLVTGTHETALPTRWKLWIAELSSSSSR